MVRLLRHFNCILLHVAFTQHSLNIHSMYCPGLLGITPSSNNGTFGSLYHMISPSFLSSLPLSSALRGASGSRDSCYFPTDDSTYSSRSFCDECVCRGQCADVSNTIINASNLLLNLNSDQGKHVATLLKSYFSLKLCIFFFIDTFFF